MSLRPALVDICFSLSEEQVGSKRRAHQLAAQLPLPSFKVRRALEVVFHFTVSIRAPLSDYPNLRECFKCQRSDRDVVQSDSDMALQHWSLHLR